MNETKVGKIEDQLAQNFRENIDTRKLYEEEIKKSYLFEKRVKVLEEKVWGFENEVTSLK